MEVKSDKPPSNEKKRKLQDAPVEPVVSPKAKRVKPDTKSSEQTNLCYTYFVQFEHPTDTTKKSSNKSSETKPQKSKSTDKVPTSQPEPSTSAAQADASANDPTEDAEDSDDHKAIDDNAVLEELLEEDELDLRDSKVADDVEAELWAKYGKESETSQDEPAVSLELKPVARSRTVRYGQPAGVKSKVFVDDSD